VITSRAVSAAPAECRCEAGVVDERARGVDQVIAHLAAAEDRTALGTQGLAEGQGGDDVLCAGQAHFVQQAPTVRSAHAERMRFVRDQEGVVGGTEFAKRTERRSVTEDRVDGLDQDDRPRLAAPLRASFTAATSLWGTTMTVPRESRQASIIDACTCASETIRVSASASAATVARLAW